MTPADFKTIRESLGLSAQWLADAVAVDQRTVRRWEDGAIPLRADVVDLVTRLEAQMLAEVNGEVERVLDDLGVNTLADLSDLDELDPQDRPVVEVPRVDADVDIDKQTELLPADLLPSGVLLPAAWYRAAAGRLRAALGGRLRITYTGA